MFANLGARLSTALILITLLLFLLITSALYCWGKVSLQIFGSLAVIICAYEWANFSCLAKGRMARGAVYFLLTLFPACYLLRAGFMLCGAGLDVEVVFYTVTASFVVSMIFACLYVVLSGNSSIEAAAAVAQEIFLGVYLIGLCGAMLLGLTLLENASYFLSWLVVVVSVNDSAAYFGGSKLAGPKLSPLISPKKTWSGAACGLILGTLVGSLLSGLLGISAWGEGFILSSLLVLSAQVGDLSKSYLKRLHEVKDSGSILPGHGGIFDRLDGILAATPVIYLWLMFRLGAE